MNTSTWYAARLAEEQAQLDAVNEALGALNLDKFNAAASKISSFSVAHCAERISVNREIAATLDVLEALAAFLKSRIAYLKPLAEQEARP